MPYTYTLFSILLNLTSTAFVIFCSISLAQMIAGNRNIMFLGTTSVVAFFALELLVFWLLAPFNQFNNLNVFLLFGALSLTVQSIKKKYEEIINIDLSKEQIPEKLVLHFTSPICLLAIFTIVLLFLQMVASCILPVMGWDYIAYRGLKAALFVQNNGLFTFKLPGGWQFYSLMPANTEIIFSYLMLGTRNDVLIIIFDFVSFILLAMPIWAYSYERTSSDWKWTLALLIWWLPVLREGIGFAQAETQLTFFLLAGILFLTDFINQRHYSSLGLCGLSLGIAYGIKPIILPQVALFGLATILIAFRDSKQALKILAIWSISFLFLSLPWFIYSSIKTGLPLSPLPISILGIELGKAPEALEWNMRRIENVPYVVPV